jgi:hypothetical protein
MTENELDYLAVPKLTSVALAASLLHEQTLGDRNERSFFQTGPQRSKPRTDI